MYPKLATVAAIGLVLMVVLPPPVLTLRYTIHNTKVTFFNALTQCIQLNGHLAAVQTPYQQAAIWKAIKKAGPTTESWWTSGTDLGMEGSWLWFSRNRRVGSVRGWTNWMDTEPNNGNSPEHCLALIGGTKAGQWSDVVCTDPRFFVCEYDV
ncbi:perlucin-like [Anopheles stephensi]|uniref:C-type lectin domain-containing protein n=1 Tax=Anopheles stephensi TaxID=30069 RepID=A0A182YED5_ANOST|nr:perlucin-like [Anopheles stephensi]